MSSFKNIIQTVLPFFFCKFLKTGKFLLPFFPIATRNTPPPPPTFFLFAKKNCNRNRTCPSFPRCSKLTFLIRKSSSADDTSKIATNIKKKATYVTRFRKWQNKILYIHLFILRITCRYNMNNIYFFI